MGAFLDKPKTEKFTVSGEGNGIRYGVSAMQGWRMEMEDAHVCDTKLKFGENYSFFGVFDGHAGPKVAQHCSKNLLHYIAAAYKDMKKTDEETRIKVAITQGFFNLDENLKVDIADDRSGTTAIVSLITPDKIIFGNCGDSRGLLCSGSDSGSNVVSFSTCDHKPFNAEEKSRIEKAGGTVMMQRVNGSLAVSRALGDFDYKRSAELKPSEQLVSPEPEVTVINRNPDSDQYLLLACDGIFDVMSNDQVMKYVAHQLTLTDKLEDICSSLIDSCLNKNSRDNMSVVLVTFPSAPKVSQEAIEKDKKFQEETIAAISTKLEEFADLALDPLDLEENAIIEQLDGTIDKMFDVYSKRPFISVKLAELRKLKFGLEDSELQHYSGPSDAADAPSELAGGLFENRGELILTSSGFPGGSDSLEQQQHVQSPLSDPDTPPPQEDNSPAAKTIM